MKKITLSKEEDVELNEREEQIYDKGHEDGMAIAMLIFIIAFGILSIGIAIFNN